MLTQSNVTNPWKHHGHKFIELKAQNPTENSNGSTMATLLSHTTESPESNGTYTWKHHGHSRTMYTNPIKTPLPYNIKLMEYT